MSNITIELTEAKPISATISEEQEFNIKNALLAKTPFIFFDDAKTGVKWTVRADYIITISIAGIK